jgi:hypothetical protein
MLIQEHRGCLRKAVRPGRAQGSEPGSPWENGYSESFDGKLQDECLNGEFSIH